MPTRSDERHDRPWPVAPAFATIRASLDPEALQLERALSEGADLLIVEDGVEIDADGVAEMRRVAGLDPMIAIVSPRLDRCPFGTPSAASPQSVAALADLLRRVLPEVSYGVLPEPGCLYVKGAVLAQFRPVPAGAGFDWDVYALSVVRRGFRSVVANHALACVAPARALPGPGRSAAERAARLEPAFAGIRAALGSALAGRVGAAERLLEGLLPEPNGRLAVAFDFTHVGPSHSGTADLARILIGCAASTWRDTYDIAVVATQQAYDVHFSGRGHAPRRVDPAAPEVFAAFIRIGQPFHWTEFDHAVRRAPVLVFFLLDTIGLDCVLIAPDELDALWRFMLAEADGLLFNSVFTEHQFDRRFPPRADQPRCASLHSLDVADYGPDAAEPPRASSVLVIGNDFAHKHVEETARLLATCRPGLDIVALGLEPGRVEGVKGHPSGGLTEDAVAELYRNASAVVYPSLYEGFGLPLLAALAHRRPIMVRALPPFEEIAAGLPQAANIHRFADDAELLRLVDADLSWIETRIDGVPRNWTDCTADLRRILEEALERVSYERVLRRLDFMVGRVDWARRKRFRAADGLDGPDPMSEAIEKAAGFAGRVAQDGVRRLARLPGARPLIGWAARRVRPRRR